MILLFKDDGRYWSLFDDCAEVHKLLADSKKEGKCETPEILLSQQIAALDATGYEYELIGPPGERPMLVFDDHNLERDRILWEVEKEYWPASTTLLLEGDWQETQQEMEIDEHIHKIVFLE